VVLPNLDQNVVFQKFKKDLVKKGLNRPKMVRDVNFRTPGGRESLRTTGERTKMPSDFFYAEIG
jgi:hypothetical protein